MALVHESMVLCSERTWGPCLARPGHCKFVLDAEGISLPSDGPGCVACDSHPPPAWLPGTVSVTSTFRRGLGACRAMRLTAWQVYTAHVMGTPRPERRRAGDPDLYLWRKSLSSLSQGAFNQRLAAPWWRRRESSCSVPMSPLPQAHSCSPGRGGGQDQ